METNNNNLQHQYNFQCFYSNLAIVKSEISYHAPHSFENTINKLIEFFEILKEDTWWIHHNVIKQDINSFINQINDYISSHLSHKKDKDYDIDDYYNIVELICNQL
jgi:hypothetical protein